jgi:hypothetical protein
MKFRKTMLIGALVALRRRARVRAGRRSMKKTPPKSHGARCERRARYRRRLCESPPRWWSTTSPRAAPRFDANLAASASAARDAWWARNQLMVEAANGYVRYLQALYQVKRGEDAAKSFYAACFQDLRAQGDATVEGLFQGREGRARHVRSAWSPRTRAAAWTWPRRRTNTRCSWRWIAYLKAVTRRAVTPGHPVTPPVSGRIPAGLRVALTVPL